MADFLSFINEILWGSALIYLLFCAGIWFTWRSGFVQFRYVRFFGRALKKSFIRQSDGITAFQALCTSLAARVGSGNIAGVALAIDLHGRPRRSVLDVGHGADRDGDIFCGVLACATL